LEEIRRHAAENIRMDFKKMKGAVAIFRTSETQYVFSCDLVRLMDEGRGTSIKS